VLLDGARLAERSMRENLVHTERLVTALPSHRALIRKIHQEGMQNV
jgi:hypothetical protein